MGAILASRMLGFVREWTVAHQIGSSAVTDAYYAAFTLPDFLNYLVAGGALGLIFIPVFTKYQVENREDEGWHVFSTVMTLMTLALVVLVGVGEIFTAQLVRFIAPGFDLAQKAEVVFLTRVMLPAQLFLWAALWALYKTPKQDSSYRLLPPSSITSGLSRAGGCYRPELGSLALQSDYYLAPSSDFSYCS
jgi:putative peptidoglycan lipid II flippase